MNLQIHPSHASQNSTSIALFSSRWLGLAILFLLLLFSTAGLHAGTHFWKGGGGNNLWSNDNNWGTGGSPYDADSDEAIYLVFPASASSFHPVCDEAITIDKLIIRGNYTFSQQQANNADAVSFRSVSAPNDNLVMDATTAPTVTFDSSTAFFFNDIIPSHLRIESGSIHIAGRLSAYQLMMDGGGQVYFETNTQAPSSPVISGGFLASDITLHLAMQNSPGAIDSLSAASTAILLEDSEQLQGATLGLNNSSLTLSPSVQDWVGLLDIRTGASVNALSGGAELILTDTITVGTGSNSLLGKFSLFGGVRTIQIANAANSLNLLGSISDGIGIVNGQQSLIGGLQKTGQGVLRMAGANSFKGPVTIAEGEVIAENSSAFGTSAGGVNLKAGAKLTLKNVTVGNESLTLAGALEVPSGTNSWAGPILLQSTAEPMVVSSTPAVASLTLSGVISGPGTLILNGGGTMKLSGSLSNTFSGEAVNRGGILRLAKTSGLAIPGPLSIIVEAANLETRVVLDEDQQLPSNSIVLFVGRDATLDLSSHNLTIGALLSIDSLPNGGVSGGGEVRMGNSRLAEGTFTVGQNNASTLFDGIITGGPNMTFDKVGTGTLNLGISNSGPNTFTGPTRVWGGTLWVGSSQKIASAIVESTGTLAGVGTCGSVILNGGRVSLTQLTTGSFSSSNSGGDIWLDYFGTLPEPLPSPYQLMVHGTLNLAHTTLTTFSLSPPQTLPPGFVYTLIDNDGSDPVLGTFTGLPEGSAVTWGAHQLTVTYQGGDGNDVALKLVGWAGGPPKISSLTYDRASDAIHLRALAQPGSSYQWQVSGTLQSWFTFNTVTPDVDGVVKFDGSLGLHADSLFFRLKGP